MIVENWKIQALRTGATAAQKDIELVIRLLGDLSNSMTPGSTPAELEPIFTAARRAGRWMSAMDSELEWIEDSK